MKIYLTVILLCAVCFGIFYEVSDVTQNLNEKKQILKVGYPGYWSDLVPALQRTAYADAIMFNQFEPLVSVGSDGNITPLAASSWTIDEKMRVFTFKIDSSRRFSDGTRLSARHFKDSWEYGLSVEPKSANSSLQDTLSRVSGYDSFEKSKKLRGIKVVDSETLVVEFDEPFRMALSYLSGTRMAAYLKKEEKFLGTGSYIIKENGERRLKLIANPFATEKGEFKEIHISVVSSAKAEKALNSGEIDLYAFAEIGNLQDCFEERSKTGCVSGSESRHIVLNVNGNQGRLFSNENYRLALQYILVSDLNGTYPKYLRHKTMIDPQVYLPVQSGRLDDAEVAEIVSRGKLHVKEFLEATKKNPIFFGSSSKDQWLRELLIAKGVSLSDESVRLKGTELLEMFYKTNEPDLIFSYASVNTGDPDGIYHVLGKHGAITSPMIQRKTVSELLEDGRKIMATDKMDIHYKNVTKAVLEKVPFVHLGFLNSAIVFRKDIVVVKDNFINRDDNLFSNYAPREM